MTLPFIDVVDEDDLDFNLDRCACIQRRSMINLCEHYVAKLVLPTWVSHELVATTKKTWAS